MLAAAAIAGGGAARHRHRCARHGCCRGRNPHPVHLVRPPVAPLSAMAQLGKRIFFDTRPVRVRPAVLRVVPRPGASLRPAAEHRAGDAGRPAAEPAGRPGGADPDLSGAAAGLQHRPGERRERDRAARRRSWPCTAPGTRAAEDRRRHRGRGGGAGAAGRAVLGRAGGHAAAAGDPAAAEPGGDGQSQRRGRGAASCGTRPMRSASSSCSGRRSCTSRDCCCPKQCSPWRATRSRRPASIPTPASSTTGWRERRGSPRPNCAATALFNDPAKANCAGCHLDRPARRRHAATLHRRPVRGAGRAAQSGAAGKPRQALLRPGAVRSVPARPACRTQVLRHVPDPDAAQCRDAACVLPQRRVPHAAAGAGLLRLSRCRSGQGVSGGAGWAAWRSSTICRRGTGRMSMSPTRRSIAAWATSRRSPSRTNATSSPSCSTLTDGYKPRP